jgi:O-antigen ligase
LLFVDTERFANIGSRVCSTFSNPNFLATYLVLVAPMFAPGILDRRRKRSLRALEGMGLAAVLLCIVLTWTRGAWLGIALATLLFLLLHSKQSFVCLLASPAVPVAVLPFLPSAVVSRFASIGGGDSSISYRLYTWRGVWRMLDAYPFGVGAGEAAFTRLYPYFAVSGTERVMHAHRLDLQLLAEVGWIGFFIFLLFFVLLFLKIINGFYRLMARERLILLGCFCALVGALVMGVFDYIWYHFGNFTLFFALAAWGMSVMREEEKRDEL